MHIPQKYRLVFSKGTPHVEALLQGYSKELPFRDALVVSQKLLKEIEKVCEQVRRSGIPDSLYLAHVNDEVQTGVFLKPSAKKIEAGTFIGVYTGLYELVEDDIGRGTSYAYDVAQELSLSKSDLCHVSRPEKKLSSQRDYSIQTNAIETGNFTRFINHTSLRNNIEAVVSKFPDGRLEILLFALHDIYPGQQLLSCYGGQYWKALSIIPNDMEASTYTLSPSHKVICSHPIAPLPKDLQKTLMPLRNIDVTFPLSLEKTPLFKVMKKKLPKLTYSMKKNIDQFEDFVLELGLPRKWQCLSQSPSFEIALKKDSRTLAKGQFIGLIAGDFSLKPSKEALCVAQKGCEALYLHTKKHKNFLSQIKESQEGNVELKLYFDKEKDEPILLAFASQTIRAGDRLKVSTPRVQKL